MTKKPPRFHDLEARGSSFGFTLIELMIVVAIIGILAAIAIPQFANLIRKSSEGTSKGNLASLRSAISVYYGDMEGQYPQDLTALTMSSKYMAAIPPAKTPSYHLDSSVDVLTATSNDASGWIYDGLSGDQNQGNVWINCTHTDTKGSVWTSY